MAKYLILSPDPGQRWLLPDEIDLQALGQQLFQALEHGHEESRDGFVLTVPVVFDGCQTGLHLRERDLSIAAVVETAETTPQIF